MKQIVYNACYGGFALSAIAEKMLYEAKHDGAKAYVYKAVFDTYETPIKYIRIDDVEEMKSYDKYSDRLHVYTKDFGKEFVDDRNLHLNEYELRTNADNVDRKDEDLIKIIETLGRKIASTSLSNLKIAEVKDKWRIVEYDGWETVETPESIKWND